MSAVFSPSADERGTDSHSPTVACQGEQQSSESARLEVGHHRLSDSEREAAIHRAGDLFLHYMAKYELTGDFQYRGDADRALQLQRLLILGRSPEQVARMEKELGLA